MSSRNYSQFELNKPFTPFQQLLCCLPPLSASLLPPSYRILITDPESPLTKYYPSEFCLDRNGKRKEFESVVLLPNVCEQDVLKAIADYHCDDSLTEDEKIRNTADTDYLFYYSEEVSTWPTPLDPSSFPAIEKCHCVREAVKDPSRLYTIMKRNTTKETRHAVFPSLYPICTGLRHIMVEKPHNRYSLNDRYYWKQETRTIVETESGYPYITTVESMKQCGMEYINQIVEYDYPRHKYGQVLEVFSYNFGCHWNQKEGAPSRNSIHAYKLDDAQKTMIKEELDKMHGMAMKGFDRDPHDMGNLDIGNNMVLVRIRPVYHIYRSQEKQSLYPFFSNQTIDYPLCLTRKVKEFNLLGGTQSLSDYSPDSVNVGNLVVYIGNTTVAKRVLKGYSGVITAVNNGTLKVCLKVPTEVPHTPFVEGDWYTEDYLRDQLPKKYAPLLHICLNSLYCSMGSSRIYLNFNCTHKSEVLEGLTKIVSQKSEKKFVDLSPSCYSRLATVTPTTTNEEILYSARTIELMKEYFRLFGAVLVASVTFSARKPVVNNERLAVRND